MINIFSRLYYIVEINPEKPYHHNNCDINTPVCRETIYNMHISN